MTWRDDLLTLSALRERGWSPAMVERFLGQADMYSDNPRFRSAAPVRLYSQDRVLAAEAMHEFTEAQERAARRSKVGKAVADRKRARLMAEIEALVIEVRSLRDVTVTDKAIASYNRRSSARYYDDDYRPAARDSDTDFLKRIKVNYIRHHLTSYDDQLEKIAGRTGITEGVTAIRRKVYAAIAEQYPDLAGECSRQLEERSWLPDDAKSEK